MEQVPSWQVTGEMLAEWGFPVQVTDKVVGTKVVVQEGMPSGKALHAAWAAGHVRMAAMPEHVRQAQMAAGRERIAEMRRMAQENLAFLRLHGTIVGPSHTQHQPAL
jgi:hypothetical protein